MKNPIFVVLAGGIGKNFSPLVTSKSVFPFFGKPLIAHTLEMIQAAGIKEAIVVCNSENEEIINKLSNKQLKITTVLQNEAAGQADAVSAASKLISEDQPIIIANAVDLIDPNFLRNFVKKSAGTYALITGMKVDEYLLTGYLEVDGEKVLGIIEKPKKGEEPSNVVNLVFHYFSKPQELLTLIAKQNGGDDAYERALDELIKSKNVQFMVYEGYWQKLKQAHHVLDMTQLFLTHKLKNKIDRTAKIDRMAKIEGPVQIEAGARILAGAVIKGPAYIGANVIVGNHSLIRDSIVEANSIIGFGSEVARSYVGPNCSLHHNFIGDSVLEAEVNPSYGTCTANLRFDGNKVKMRLASKNGGKDQLIETNKEKLGTIMAKGVFLGVNCSILPGITLAAKATAYPGSVIDRSLAAEEMFPKSR
jgi:bifunctional UDP-N-acetylglucosamine pyrophosphorylase/glucosamine-1-phosphate N-acetyltransferase